jgi:hypothetical protein
VASSLKNRLTVVERIYHQIPGEQPTLIDYRHSKLLESDESPYIRHNLKLTEEWTLLDKGWIEGDVSSIVLSNEEGKSTQVNPTEEEVAALKKKIVEIAFVLGEIGNFPSKSHQEIPPSEQLRIFPSTGVQIFLRSRCGISKASVTVYPA